MSISLLDGGVSSTTGGTTQTFSEIGKNVTNGIALSDTGEPDYFARAELQCSIRMPSLQSDGEYSKNKRTVKYVKPLTLASGKIVYNTISFIVDFHPESTAAQLADLREKGAQIGIDSEFDEFFANGKISL